MTALNLLTSYGSDSEDSNSPCNIIPDKLPLPSQSNFFEAEEASSGEEVPYTAANTNSNSVSTNNLENPFRSSEAGSIKGPSVFTNPFKDAEDAVQCKLEQHVKLTPKLEDVKEINGRKICWSYRKGRCRFGSKCVFAHDCELINKKNVPLMDQDAPYIDIVGPHSTERKGIKRPGLSQGIVPGKKVLRKYNQLKTDSNNV